MIRTIPEHQVHEYWLAGWTYVGAAADPSYAVVRWDNPTRPRIPVFDDNEHVTSAVASLEAVA